MMDYDGGISLPSATATASSLQNHPVLQTLAVENTPSENTISSEFIHQQQHQLNILDQPISPNTAGDRPSSSRRSRGRPLGSKNKPKTPFILPLDSEPPMNTVVLQVPSGFDIVETIANYTRRQPVKGFMVMSASGSVSGVTIRHPNAPDISLTGPLNILSLNGTYSGSYINNSADNVCFRISVDATQGQVYGGGVVGKLIAASPILVIGTTFMNSMFHRLTSGIFDNVDHSIQQIHGGGSGGGGGVGEGEGGFDHRNPGMPMMTVHGVANPEPITIVAPIPPRR